MSMVTNFSEVFAYAIGLQNSQFKGQTIDDVQAKLDKLFDEIKKVSLLSFPEEAYSDSLFAICAWIDELVLCSSWREKLAWKKKMLQTKYFNTTRAGEVFFDKLDAIPPGEISLLEIYYYCLKLGFKGKFHRGQDNAILTEKCKNYYRLIIDQYGGDFNKPLVNCTITPLAEVENARPLGGDRSAIKSFWSKLVWWLIPLIPFGIVTIVFNEVIQAMASDYFKSLS